MDGETNDFDTVASEIESAEPSQTDDRPDWDYYDPDEDQDEVVETQDEGTVDEAAETEADHEAEDEAEEAAEQSEPEFLEAQDRVHCVDEPVNRRE